MLCLMTYTIWCTFYCSQCIHVMFNAMLKCSFIHSNFPFKVDNDNNDCQYYSPVLLMLMCVCVCQDLPLRKPGVQQYAWGLITLSCMSYISLFRGIQLFLHMVFSSDLSLHIVGLVNSFDYFHYLSHFFAWHSWVFSCFFLILHNYLY